MDICVAALDELSPRVLHDILRLRSDVFVVEQECVYPDVDGRDLWEGTHQYWIAGDCPDGGAVAASIRVLDHLDRPGVRIIGRVVTHPAWRGQGLAAALIQRALDDHPGTAFHLSAQAHLRAYYERFGFAVSGDGYLEDGIPHLPMDRPVSPT